MKTEESEKIVKEEKMQRAERSAEAELFAEKKPTAKASAKKKKRGRLFSGALKKLLLPITHTLDSVNADFSDRSHFRRALIAMLKLRTPICVFLAAVIAASACYFWFKSENTATTEMSLNYEESARGMNPNSTRFNAYDITSQNVVSSMLSYCGIDPESVDLSEVSSCITIRPTNAKSFSEETLYISTSYKISIRKPSFLKGVSADELLTFLCKAYKDNLYRNYTENRSILDFDIDTFHDEEFMEIADLLDLKAQQIEKYLNTRAKQNKTFTEEESNESFKSLFQKVEDLRDYDIAKYRAFVTQAGCSANKDRYIRALSYTNRINGLSYAKDMAAYNVRNDGIKMYNESMISVVMIPSIDLNKNTYYMSKTKTGMDYMAKQANDYLLTAQETAKSIETNKDIISKMYVGTNSAENIQKANDMIKDIRQKFTELSRQIETVDKAYIKYRTKDYLTFKTSSPSFAQRLEPVTLALIAIVMLLGIFVLIWFRYRYLSGGNQSEGISVNTVPLQR